MQSKTRKITFYPAATSPFGRWMELCAAPVAWQLDELGLTGSHSHNTYIQTAYFGALLIVLAEALVFCGAGLAVWCVLRAIALAIRKTQRPKYYPAEKMRRQALAAERRHVRRRFTINPAPTREELLAQFARIKRNPREMIRFGSMLCDLEAYVDNSLRRDRNGVIIGRNPGIRGWLAENCVELCARYKTVMRYKAMAEQFRQAIGLRDPLPAALALDGEGDTDENENTVRKVSLEEHVVIGKARKRATEFFAKCGVTMRGTFAELNKRLGPDNVPRELVVRERLRQGLSPEPGAAERFVATVLA